MTLDLSEDVGYFKARLYAALGVPNDFIEGDTRLSGSAASLRLYEAGMRRDQRWLWKRIRRRFFVGLEGPPKKKPYRHGKASKNAQRARKKRLRSVAAIAGKMRFSRFKLGDQNR